MCIRDRLFTTNQYADTGLTGMDLLRMGLERSETAQGAMETIIALLEDVYKRQTQYVAPQMAEKQGLTIITNSFYMMQTLCKIPDAVIYLAGGMVYRDSASVVGEYANEFLSQFKVKKTILGIDGLSVEYGLTDADSREPQSLSIKKKMIQACDELIIVCDHSKIGRACLAPVEQLSRVSYLVTGEGEMCIRDSRCSPGQRKQHLLQCPYAHARL